MPRKLVGILIFPEVEVLDFCGPYEVFSVTRLDEARRREDPSPFQVLLVAETLAAVEAAGGMRVLPDCTLADCPPLNILVATLLLLGSGLLGLAGVRRRFKRS